MNGNSRGTNGLPWQKMHLCDVYDVLVEVASRNSGAMLLTTNSTGKLNGSSAEAVLIRSIKRIITLIDVESRALLNILQNPQVSWVMTGEKLDRFIHLKGKASVVHDPARVKSIFASLSHLLQSRLMDQRQFGIDHFPIETRISEIEYHSPKSGIRSVYDVAQIEDYSSLQDRNAPIWVRKYPFKSSDNERLR